MVVDQDVQTDVPMADDEAAEGTNEPEDVGCNLIVPPTDADSKSNPAPPTTTNFSRMDMDCTVLKWRSSFFDFVRVGKTRVR